MSITSSSKFPEIVLILITILWGGTFLAVHYALNFTSPIFFVGTRFGIAAAVLFLVSYQQLRNFSRQEVIAGFFHWYRYRLFLCISNGRPANDHK